MFTTRFEVIEVYESGLRVTHYLRGSKKNIKKAKETYKNLAKDYQLVGKKAMIVFY